MRGIRRERGSAKPLLRDDLFAVLSATADALKDSRDRALLLIGFAGGFRRSELVTLATADIEHVRQGLVITLRRSKTDQEGVQAGFAPATKRAYRTDLDHFQAWGGTVPATDGQVAGYLAEHAETLSVATLGRRVCLDLCRQNVRADVCTQ